jgi:hydrogenase nickel incorporation protein HypA/HybF
MHELAITQGVVEAVTERTGTVPVVCVRLRVGRLSGVVPDAMRFCFELVTAGTPLGGATLELEQPEGRGRCRTTATFTCLCWSGVAFDQGSPPSRGVRRS